MSSRKKEIPIKILQKKAKQEGISESIAVKRFLNYRKINRKDVLKNQCCYNCAAAQEVVYNGGAIRIQCAWVGERVDNDADISPYYICRDYVRSYMKDHRKTKEV